MNKSKLYNAEYSALQGTYWMVFGVIVSFAAVFLQSRGYSNSELGAIMAAGNIAAVILQPVVADFADRSRRVSLIGIIAAIAAVMALAMLTSLLVPGRSAVVATAYALYICCVFLMQPLVNSFAAFLESWRAEINFGVARGIGSLGYAVLVAVLGIAVERLSAQVLPVAGLAVTALMLMLLAVLACQYKRAPVVFVSGEKNESRSAPCW